MIYLIAHLSGWLLLTALFAALAGWIYAAQRAALVLSDSAYSRTDTLRFLHLEAKRVQVVYGAQSPAFRKIGVKRDGFLKMTDCFFQRYTRAQVELIESFHISQICFDIVGFNTRAYVIAQYRLQVGGDSATNFFFNRHDVGEVFVIALAGPNDTTIAGAAQDNVDL